MVTCNRKKHLCKHKLMQIRERTWLFLLDSHDECYRIESKLKVLFIPFIKSSLLSHYLHYWLLSTELLLFFLAVAVTQIFITCSDSSSKVRKRELQLFLSVGKHHSCTEVYSSRKTTSESSNISLEQISLGQKKVIQVCISLRK